MSLVPQLFCTALTGPQLLGTISRLNFLLWIILRTCDLFSMRFPRFKHQVVRHQNRWIKGFDFNICWWFLSPIKSAYFKKMTLTFRQRLRRRLVAPLTPHLPPSVASSPWLWKGCRRRRSVDRTPCQWDWRSSLAENYPLAIEHC